MINIVSEPDVPIGSKKTLQTTKSLHHNQFSEIHGKGTLSAGSGVHTVRTARPTIGGLLCCFSTASAPHPRWDELPLRLQVCDPGERLLVFKLNSQSNTPSLPCFQSNVLIGWNRVWLSWSHFACLPFTEPGLCITTIILLAHTQKFTVYWIRITDCIFKAHKSFFFISEPISTLGHEDYIYNSLLGLHL